jgi:hypothetical protein
VPAGTCVPQQMPPPQSMQSPTTCWVFTLILFPSTQYGSAAIFILLCRPSIIGGR